MMCVNAEFFAAISILFIASQIQNGIFSGGNDL